MKKVESIDDFIASYPSNVQEILHKLRKLVKEEAPETSEKIAYGIPTFTLNGNLVHFSAYEKHIGLYPTSSPITAFAKELKPYKTSKGAVQFPLTQPLPWPLIRKIVRFRVKEQRGKAF